MRTSKGIKARSTVSINNVPLRLIVAQLLLFIICISIPFLVTILRGLNFKEHGIEAVAIANSVSVYRSPVYWKGRIYHSTQTYEFCDTYHTFLTGAFGYIRLPRGSAVPIIYLPDNHKSAVLGTKADSPLELAHMSTFFEWNARLLLGIILYLATVYGTFYYINRTPEGFSKFDFFFSGPAVSLFFLKRIHFDIVILLSVFISIIVYFTGLVVNKHQPQLLEKSCGEGAFAGYRLKNDSITIVYNTRIWGILRSDQFSIGYFPFDLVNPYANLNGVSVYCFINRVGKRSTVSVYTYKRAPLKPDSIMDSCFFYFDNKTFPSCRSAENFSGVIISAGDTTCSFQVNSLSLPEAITPEKESGAIHVFKAQSGSYHPLEDSIIKHFRNLMEQLENIKFNTQKYIDSGR